MSDPFIPPDHDIYPEDNIPPQYICMACKTVIGPIWDDNEHQCNCDVYEFEVWRVAPMGESDKFLSELFAHYEDLKDDFNPYEIELLAQKLRQGSSTESATADIVLKIINAYEASIDPVSIV